MIRDSSGRPVYHYRKGAAAPRKEHDDAEHRFQVTVFEYLDFAMPPGYLYTANAAGVRVGMQTAIKMKAAGVRRGWSDVQILFPTAVTRYIELKTDKGRLSPEQEGFRDCCIATGRDIWALARTLEDVEAALLRWKVPVRVPLAKANRYAV